MGMYTEVVIGVEFKKDTPQSVIDILSWMANKDAEDAPLPELPDHPLFTTERWKWMLRSGGSYYFDLQPFLEWRKDDIADLWFLSVGTNIKNYGNEWQEFLSFIAPHLRYPDRKFIGYYRYEEDEEPTLLYADGNGGIEWRQIAAAASAGKEGA